MRVVVDANVVAAALVRPTGWTAQQFARSDVSFFAPNFLRTELEACEGSYAEKAGCTVDEWRRRVEALLGILRFVAADRVRRHSRRALVRAMEQADPDDTPYVAAFVEANAEFLWTRDKAVKAVLGERAGPVIP